jgi:hypothetical protein
MTERRYVLGGRLRLPPLGKRCQRDRRHQGRLDDERIGSWGDPKIIESAVDFLATLAGGGAALERAAER